MNSHPKEDKNRTIYNGVKFEKQNKNDSKKQLGLNPEDIIIGFVGRLEKNKNPLPLAGAVNLLPKKYKAIFVGREGDVLSQSLKQISKKIIYFPHQQNINPFWNALDALVVTSNAEAFGLNIVEAWAAGIPVLSTNVGIIKELSTLYGKDLAIVLPNDPSEYTVKNAIEKAFTDKEYQKTIKICQDLYKEYFHSKRMSQDWEELFAACKNDSNYNQKTIPENVINLILSAPDLTRIQQSTEESKIKQFIQIESQMEAQKGCGCGGKQTQPSNKIEQYRDSIKEIKNKKLKKLL